MKKPYLNFLMIAMMAVSTVGCGSSINVATDAAASDDTASDPFVGIWLNAESLEASCIDIPAEYRFTIPDENGDDYEVRYIQNYNVVSKVSDGVYLNESIAIVYKQAACAGSEFYIKSIEASPYMQLTTNSAEQSPAEDQIIYKLSAPSIASDQQVWAMSGPDNDTTIENWALVVSVGDQLAIEILFDYSGPGADSYTQEQVLESLDTYIGALSTFIASPIDEAVQVWTKI